MSVLNALAENHQRQQTHETQPAAQIKGFYTMPHHLKERPQSTSTFDYAFPSFVVVCLLLLFIFFAMQSSTEPRRIADRLSRPIENSREQEVELRAIDIAAKIGDSQGYLNARLTGLGLLTASAALLFQIFAIHMQSRELRLQSQGVRDSVKTTKEQQRIMQQQTEALLTTAYLQSRMAHPELAKFLLPLLPQTASPSPATRHATKSALHLITLALGIPRPDCPESTELAYGEIILRTKLPHALEMLVSAAQTIADYETANAFFEGYMSRLENLNDDVWKARTELCRFAITGLENSEIFDRNVWDLFKEQIEEVESAELMEALDQAFDRKTR